MSLEDKLAGWTGPSSATEQQKQERTERVVREAIQAHSAFDDCSYTVYAKGSYPNNTNVRTESDVDIAVQCHECQYYEKVTPDAHVSPGSYTGIWTPERLRREVGAALEAKFPGKVDSTGRIVFKIDSDNSGRVDADVAPCFDYRYYFSETSFRDGSRIIPTTGAYLTNYPDQQLNYGRDKNNRTSTSYKKTVRILKCVSIDMAKDDVYPEMASFFLESLGSNCPDEYFLRTSWTSRVSGVLWHIWDSLQGDAEPEDDSERWLEANCCKYLFHSAQKWTRSDGRGFARAAWNHLGYPT